MASVFSEDNKQPGYRILALEKAKTKQDWLLLFRPVVSFPSELSKRYLHLFHSSVFLMSFSLSIGTTICNLG